MPVTRSSVALGLGGLGVDGLDVHLPGCVSSAYSKAYSHTALAHHCWGWRGRDLGQLGPPPPFFKINLAMS